GVRGAVRTDAGRRRCDREPLWCADGRHRPDRPRPLLQPPLAILHDLSRRDGRPRLRVAGAAPAHRAGRCSRGHEATMRPNRRLILGPIVLATMATVGCATKMAQPPLPDDLRRELGVVAVVISPESSLDPRLTSPVPSRAGAAAVGAGVGL